MRLKFRQNNKLQQAGFTILVAVVTASILLIIAMSIGGIALKEQVLSTSGKESQVAFFAADSAMECALYWDQKKGVFAPNQDGGLPQNITASVDCNNNGSISVAYQTISSSGAGAFQYSYSFTENGISINGGTGTTCAQAVVTKTKYPAGSRDKNDNLLDPTKIYTTVNTYGYSTCGASLNRLERGIIANY